ncbi:hypothetical protein [Amycolatopsis australiensis]|uniref:Uncharacterized protein n=1 Tax=Amycolatopsis australiensis TaxID=546364 RepID=A0A1K1RGK8_9PSEU|nr:hypothetical protein [Amycolatopsis australiensis]SFW71004.1 hypothetical protein SAMN04489730_3204 [Amycolatopsis australiensis]
MATERDDREVNEFYLRMLAAGDGKPVAIGAPADDPVARVIQQIVDGVLSYVDLEMSDPAVAELMRSDRIAVRTIPPASIQALTVWIEPRHVVAFNRGLGLFLYRLARAFAGNYIVRGPGDPPAPPESDAISIIATLLDWMASPVRAPLLQDWEVGPREIKTAENFTTAAERFVMCHELAHIMYGHLIADSSAFTTDSVSLADLDTRPLRQETEADVAGAVLAIDSMPHIGIDPRAAAHGIYFFFWALDLAERVGAVLTDGSHLAAAERLEVCRFGIGQWYGEESATTLFKPVDETGELLSRLGEAAFELQRGRRFLVASRMDELFAKTSWPEWPQQEQMSELRREVMDMMLEAPSAVVDALAANLLNHGDYAALLKSMASPDERQYNDRWRRHQIAHFLARHAPEQVRTCLGVTTFP